MIQEQKMSPSANELLVDVVDVETAALDLPVCGMCLHPRESHDLIATRYCEATASSALARGCVCRPSAGAGEPATGT
jgi:hypothetical protein